MALPEALERAPFCGRDEKQGPAMMASVPTFALTEITPGECRRADGAKNPRLEVDSQRALHHLTRARRGRLAEPPVGLRDDARRRIEGEGQSRDRKSVVQGKSVDLGGRR